MLSPNVKEILGLPDYYVDEYNSTATQNFFCIIRRLIEIFNSKHVCEIGVERGFSSENLRKYTYQLGIKHSLVDPNLNEPRKRLLPEINFYEQKSLDFFKNDFTDFPDFFLLDGDHNYYTVSEEIKAIHQKSKKTNRPICILLHDVGWPWGRRDMFYSPREAIIPEGKIAYQASLCLEHEGFSSRGFPSGEVYATRSEYGGPQNGVLTAVEDFVKSNQNWKFQTIPIFYGMGVLWCSDHLSKENSQRLASYMDFIKDIKDLLSSAEANRLRLLQGLDEYKNDLENRVKDVQNLKAEIDRKKSFTEKLKKLFSN